MAFDLVLTTLYIYTFICYIMYLVTVKQKYSLIFYFFLSFFRNYLISQIRRKKFKQILFRFLFIQTLPNCVQRVTNEHLFSGYVIENSR